MEMETETETETETSDEDMEMEMLVFEVTEIDLEYEFDAARWFDLTREELSSEARVAELWFESAQSYPHSPFAKKLLMNMEVSDEKTESLSKSDDEEVVIDDQDSDREVRQQIDVNETGNGMRRSGVFTFIQGGTLNKVPNHSLHKGPTTTFSNQIQTDKLKCRPKSSIRPIPRSSTLMKPTASILAKQDNARVHMQVDEIKENCLFPSSVSEIQSSKRQKLDGGAPRKVAETKQEMNFVHKAIKKDLDRNSQHARTKITVPHEPDFATSHRANRIRVKDDAKLESVHRFKARPLNRKIFEAPSLPIRKRSTPKLPEFQEFRLKTSERAMQHPSSYQGNNYHKGSGTSAFLDGVNREPRRPKAMDMPKDDDRKHLSKANNPLNNKIISSRQDIGKRDTTVPLESKFHSEKRVQQDLPTDLFSKLSIKSELQPKNGSRLRIPQPEVVKGSKENRLKWFQAANERTSKVTGKPMVQRGVVAEASQRWTGRRQVTSSAVQQN